MLFSPQIPSVGNPAEKTVSPEALGMKITIYAQEARLIYYRDAIW